MYSRDYVKRMIEEIGILAREIKLLLTQGEPARAIERLDAAYREHLGLDRDLIHRTSDDFLILATGVGRVGDVDKTLLLADLLGIEAEIHTGAGETALADDCLHKALSVLLSAFLRLNYAGSEAHVERIEPLLMHFAGHDLPVSTLQNVFKYYEQRGAFARAEDTLYELIAHDEYYVERGIEFYQRLLTLPAHELAHGGLPRDETQDGLEKLIDRQLKGL